MRCKHCGKPIFRVQGFIYEAWSHSEDNFFDSLCNKDGNYGYATPEEE